MSGEKGKEKNHFSTVVLSELPNGRRSKHTQIVNRILDELWKLQGENALRVDRESFGNEKLSNVRAAVSRAVKKHGLDVATATDNEYFYIWFNSHKPSKADGHHKADGQGKVDGQGKTMRLQAEDTRYYGSEGAGKHFQPPTPEGNGRNKKR